MTNPISFIYTIWESRINIHSSFGVTRNPYDCHFISHSPSFTFYFLFPSCLSLSYLVKMTENKLYLLNILRVHNLMQCIMCKINELSTFLSLNLGSQIMFTLFISCWPHKHFPTHRLRFNVIFLCILLLNLGLLLIIYQLFCQVIHLLALPCYPTFKTLLETNTSNELEWTVYQQSPIQHWFILFINYYLVRYPRFT